MLLDLTKTVSFAVLHFAVGFTVAYLLTGSIAVATGVALVAPAVNTVVFFCHEQVWKRFRQMAPAAAGLPAAARPGVD